MKLPATVHNRISYVGAAVAALALMAIVFLFIVNTLVGRGEAPYAGIVIFVVLPAFLLGGLALIPLGMLLEWRRLRRGGAPSIPKFPVIDLNLPHHRNAAIIFTVGSVLLLFLSIFGSYQAYEATESVAFCGTTCHTVMEPEYVTYQHSPHARIRCVECHVGPGADWYIRSKLSGLHQLYGVIFDSYPRPIVGPIRNLRPAQDTCEHCHWPEMFFGEQERRRTHFLADAANSPWEIRLLVKTGGGAVAPQGRGIHWHMNLDNQVEYVAADPARQEIPWVRSTDRRTGRSVVYRADGEAGSDPPAGEVRTMDCIDCHNRPSHAYVPPSRAVDDALLNGEIDRTLPSIKETGVRLLVGEYASVDEAFQSIATGLDEFYRTEHPAVAESQRPAIEQATRALQRIYRENFFPLMKARWDVYPVNTGHFIFKGCFRCHDGEHRNADGAAITASCTACHVITAQGPPDALQFSNDPDGLPFQHPGEGGDLWESMPCSDCHTGG